MRTAYWSEPKPLKMDYPSGASNLENAILATAIMLAITSLTLLSSAAGFPGSIWLFSLIVAIPGLLAVGCFFIAKPAAHRRRDRQWKKAFLANNHDLELNMVAIRQTIEYMKKHTTYFNVNFENVAVHLACSLRQEDRFSSNNHTTFSREVLHAYLHFATGEVDLQPSSCPKAV